MHPYRIQAKQPLPSTTSNEMTLCASLELSRATWLVTVLSPGSQKMSKFSTSAGNGDALIDFLRHLQSKAEAVTGGPVGIAIIQEAGLDGFWAHRLLKARGIESHVVDPASIAVPRRKRRAKTDVIDGETLLRTLLAWRWVNHAFARW
jgi:transposase